MCKYCVILFDSFREGKKVKCSDYPGLEEMATVCVLCNDSSVDFNDVSTVLIRKGLDFNEGYYFDIVTRFVNLKMNVENVSELH